MLIRLIRRTKGTCLLLSIQLAILLPLLLLNWLLLTWLLLICWGSIVCWGSRSTYTNNKNKNKTTQVPDGGNEPPGNIIGGRVLSSGFNNRGGNSRGTSLIIVLILCGLVMTEYDNLAQSARQSLVARQTSKTTFFPASALFGKPCQTTAMLRNKQFIEWETYREDRYRSKGYKLLATNEIIDSAPTQSPDTYPKSLPSKKLQLAKQYEGYGVISTEDIQQRQFVVEYTGELIGRNRKKWRNYTKYLIKIKDTFYNHYLDASKRGNIARYINHSCDPNLKLVLKTKGGYPACCLYSIKNIRKGDFLSWDYFSGDELNFSDLDGVCLCGTDVCRK